LEPKSTGGDIQFLYSFSTALQCPPDAAGKQLAT
jgi:hypothetical protein